MRLACMGSLSAEIFPTSGLLSIGISAALVLEPHFEPSCCLSLSCCGVLAVGFQSYKLAFTLLCALAPC